jgi:hypothetical protein
VTTRSTEEFSDTFESAVAAALEELERDPSFNQTEFAETPISVTEEIFADDQAIEDVAEQTTDATESATQPEGVEEEVEEIFGDLDEVTEEEGQAPLNVDSLTFQLPGYEEPVSIAEMKDGYLRQSDYTQKTQKLAEERERLADAERFWSSLEENPVEVVRHLAVEAGIIAEGDEPLAPMEVSPLRTVDAVEAEVNRRVEEAVASHPAVQQGLVVQAKQWMDNSFHQIEDTYKTPLGPKSRKRILVEAQKAGTSDLELVFNALRAKQQSQAASADELRAASPSRSTGRSTRVAPEEPDSIEAAFLLAEASQGRR